MLMRFPALMLVCGGMSTLSAADGDYWLRINANIWGPTADGNVEYTSNTALGSDTFSLDEIGLENSEVSPYIEASIKVPILFTLYAGYSGFSSEGDEVIEREIVIEDITFPVNTALSSEIELNDLYGEISWRILPLDMAGIGIGLAAHALDARFESSGNGETAGFDETIPLPTLAIRAHVQPLPSLRAEGRLHWISLGIDDYDGTFIDLDLKVIYQPWELLGIGVGYRHQVYDFEATDVNDVDRAVVDLTLSGPYAGVTFTF